MNYLLNFTGVCLHLHESVSLHVSVIGHLILSDNLVNVDCSPKLELYVKQSHSTTSEAQHSPSSIQKAIAEFVGTYILLFAGCGAALVNERLPITIVDIAIVSGFALTVAIYSVGHVSGAHFNPAVTIALAVVQKIQLKLVSNSLLAKC
ncbi:aquaporin NIP3-1-like [Cicer arietinum]|uniref:aquaporin NIP3-1-like n=1 Tax=Cicer arietinum TaxID=3827 RepID=UPI003CC533D0